jgi:thiol-disulfide isomerase/thioredoxin
MNTRRSLIWALILVAALAAGVGVGVWRLTPEPAARADWFFQLEAPNAAGQQERLAAHRGPLTLVNFWATWCPPCIEEMPELSQFHTDLSSSGVKVIGIAVDSPSSVRAFLEERPVSYPSFTMGASGSELARRLGAPADALPYTVLINEKGDVVKQKMGKITGEELRTWIKELK